MKPEQRLLLAIGLSMGVLLAWTLLFPPPPMPMEAPSVSQMPAKPLQSPEPAEREQGFDLGSRSLGIGQIQGGIRSLRIDGAHLLVKSNPGILQIEPIKPAAEMLRFETTQQEGVILSQALFHGSKITRRISQSKENNSFIDLYLHIQNDSQQAERYQFKLVAYRPLHADSPDDQRYREGFISVGGKREHLRLRPGQVREFPGAPAWITSQAKSHAVIVQPRSPVKMFHVEHLSDKGPVGWLILPEVELPPGGQAEWDLNLYAGPMDAAPLGESNLDGAISFGAFSGISKLLLELLTWSKGWLQSYGGAILFLSFSIWILFFPLTWSGIRMMKVMGEIQPQLERIRREHAKNPQRMNREMMELYKKHRVNPLSGCLPLFLQMPIFIALYQVLSRSDQLRGARFLWIRDLSAPDALVRFAAPLPLIGESLNILPILMVAAMFIQQRMTQRPQAALSEEQAMQQQIFRWFPLLFGVLFYRLPSGLVLYWVTNTTFTLIQQVLALKVHRPLSSDPG